MGLIIAIALQLKDYELLFLSAAFFCNNFIATTMRVFTRLFSVCEGEFKVLVGVCKRVLNVKDMVKYCYIVCESKF